MKDPLAYRVRPKTLEDVLGQEALVGKDGFLTLSAEKKMPFSFILFGPPGTGKTTIAEAYSRSIKLPYFKLNAVTTSKKEMESTIEIAKLSRPALIIMDEVHRLDKVKQDLLLPYVEEGSFFLIGATTANPYIAINRAIRSRTRIFEVKPLNDEQVIQGLKRAIKEKDGLNDTYKLDDEALSYIAKLSGGDLRFALNLLEALTIKYDGKEVITREMVMALERVPNFMSDKNEEEHYDSVSALQKSVRGSDVDAALYYLSRLMIAGDLDSIKRRLLVTAYEDVGLANPMAVLRCQMALQAAEQVGFPEATIPLGFTVCELALSPKSKNATLAVQAAMGFASTTPFSVQDYLKLTPVNMKEEDKYPYDRLDIWEKIQYLPEQYKNKEFYHPKTDTLSNYEKGLNENYYRLKKQGRTSDLAKLKAKK